MTTCPSHTPFHAPFCAGLLALFAAALWPALAYPCAPFYAPGIDVGIEREKALIVWDEARHMEHFVRSADFHTTASSFGFLVPTPSRPTVGEASDKVFEALSTLTMRSKVVKTRWSVAPVGCTMMPFAIASHRDIGVTAPPPVTVVEETRVAGMDATVLAATDSAGLSAWLGNRGFAIREDLKRWLDVYIAKKWYLVAFRYERPDLASAGTFVPDAIDSQAVRISFPTDQPVYPYREPGDTHAVPGRVLNLFVVASRGMQGLMVDRGGEPWAPRQWFSGGVSVPTGVAAALPGVDLPAHAWVTEFGDPTSKRVATDIVFLPSPSRAEVRRPAAIDYDDRTFYIPYELLFVAAALVWWWRQRDRKSTA
jgi:hypothetical protein